MLNLLKNRRSVRKYLDKEIEQDKIDIILKCALLSPSSRSKRPWEFIAVTDKVVLRELSECKEQSAQFLKDAPLGVVVIADTEKCDVWVEDTSIASTIIQLTAQSLGLGSCWIQVRNRNHDVTLTADEYIKDVLNIPSNYSVLNIIAIGYPDEAKKPYSENELVYDKVHYSMF